VRFHALAAATACASGTRVPFELDGFVVGSVARVHLPLLAAHDEWLEVRSDRVAWRGGDTDRDAVFDRLHRQLHQQGHIVAWRDETYPVLEPASQRVLARIERAASRFWGTLTFGAHATGFVAGADGRPAWLWIAQRSFSKATDPGLYDNLVGGGVPHGQSPAETLVREAWEEAGLRPGQLSGMRAAGTLRVARDIPEGFQHEWLHAFDIELPPELTPHNQDGEVAGFTRMPVAQALAVAAGTTMTVDAALVTIDFAQRRGLLDDAEAAAVLRKLRVESGSDARR
jgi:8-oxo-dGTP pyrophosphatase MutT (NUDIX family)